MNEALLGKWLWRFGMEPEAWWRELIKVKFGMDRGSEWRSSCYGVTSGWSVWFWIWKESPSFWEFAFVDPGGGERVRFWNDIWVQGKHLVSEFPRITAAAQSPDAFITDLFSVGDRVEWNIDLSVTLRGGARVELLRLQELLLTLPPLSNGQPQLKWCLDVRHGFSVKSYVSAILLSKFPGNPDFPVSAVWIQSAPTKVCCFAWLASLNSIATIDNLRRRGIITPNRCVLWQRSLLVTFYFTVVSPTEFGHVFCKRLVVSFPFLERPRIC
ncbi:Putative ribonuclease H protein At1g65750 [Linum grandiflorum]